MIPLGGKSVVLGPIFFQESVFSRELFFASSIPNEVVRLRGIPFVIHAIAVSVPTDQSLYNSAALY